MFATIATVLDGLNGPQLLFLVGLVVIVFGAGVTIGAAFGQPRADFDRLELPPRSRKP